MLDLHGYSTIKGNSFHITWLLPALTLLPSPSQIRMGKYGEDRKGEMIDLGFKYDNQRAKYGFDLVKSALLKYKDIHGNFLVKQKFLVPREAAWPESTWGIKLGMIKREAYLNA